MQKRKIASKRTERKAIEKKLTTAMSEGVEAIQSLN